MSDSTGIIEQFANREYKWGLVTDIESDVIPRGMNEGVVRLISARKNEPEWLLEWRLKAFRHWQTMEEPAWANVRYPAIDSTIRTSSTTPPRRAKKMRPRAWTKSTRNC